MCRPSHLLRSTKVNFHPACPPTSELLCLIDSRLLEINPATHVNVTIWFLGCPQRHLMWVESAGGEGPWEEPQMRSRGGETGFLQTEVCLWRSQKPNCTLMPSVPANGHYFKWYFKCNNCYISGLFITLINATSSLLLPQPNGDIIIIIIIRQKSGCNSVSFSEFELTSVSSPTHALHIMYRMTSCIFIFSRFGQNATFKGCFMVTELQNKTELLPQCSYQTLYLLQMLRFLAGKK